MNNFSGLIRPLFLHWGLDIHTQEKCKSMIRQLGGDVYDDSSHYYNDAMYLVCPNNCRWTPNEILLGSIAAGKYIVTPKFLYDSLASKRFISPFSYWPTSLKRPPDDKPRGKLFQHWNVVLVVRDTKRTSSLKRILYAGLCKIKTWSISELNQKSSKDLSTITHVLTEPCYLQDQDMVIFISNCKRGRWQIKVYSYYVVYQYIKDNSHSNNGDHPRYDQFNIENDDLMKQLHRAKAEPYRVKRKPADDSDDDCIIINDTKQTNKTKMPPGVVEISKRVKTEGGQQCLDGLSKWHLKKTKTAPVKQPNLPEVVEIDCSDDDDDEIIVITDKRPPVRNRRGILFNARPGPNARPYSGVKEIQHRKPMVSGESTSELLRQEAYVLVGNKLKVNTDKFLNLHTRGAQGDFKFNSAPRNTKAELITIDDEDDKDIEIVDLSSSDEDPEPMSPPRSKQDHTGLLIDSDEEEPGKKSPKSSIPVEVEIISSSDDEQEERIKEVLEPDSESDDIVNPESGAPPMITPASPEQDEIDNGTDSSVDLEEMPTPKLAQSVQAEEELPIPMETSSSMEPMLTSEPSTEIPPTQIDTQVDDTQSQEPIGTEKTNAFRDPDVIRKLQEEMGQPQMEISEIDSQPSENVPTMPSQESGMSSASQESESILPQVIVPSVKEPKKNSLDKDDLTLQVLYTLTRRLTSTDECLDISEVRQRTTHYDRFAETNWTRKGAVDKKGRPLANVVSDDANNKTFGLYDEELKEYDSWDLLKSEALLHSMISSTVMPQAHSLHKILNNYIIQYGLDECLEYRTGDFHLLAKRGFRLLNLVLFLHPPTNPARRLYYLSFLRRNFDEDIQGVDQQKMNDCWKFLINLLRRVAGEESIQTQLALKIVVAILERDFDYWWKHFRKNEKPILLMMIEHDTKLIECLDQVLEMYPNMSDGTLQRGLVRQIIAMFALLASRIDFDKKAADLSRRDNMKTKVGLRVYQTFNRMDLTVRDLQMELALLRPSWLVVLVTREVIKAQANIELTVLSIKDVYTQLVKVKEGDEDTQSDSQHEKLAQGDGPEDFVDLTIESIPGPLGITTSPRKTKRTSLDPLMTNRYGETPVHIACKKGDVPKLRALLDAPTVDVNVQDNMGWTPLHEAVAGDHTECVKLLFEYRTSVKDIRSYFCSAAKNEEKIVNLRLVGGDEKLTPFLDAVRLNCSNTVNLFLKKAKELSAKYKSFPTIQELFQQVDRDGNDVWTLCQNSELRKLLQTYSPSPSQELMEVDAQALVPKNLEMFQTGAALLVANLFNVFPVHVVSTRVQFEKTRKGNERFEIFAKMEKLKEKKDYSMFRKTFRMDNKISVDYRSFTRDMKFYESRKKKKADERPDCLIKRFLALTL